MGGNFQASVPLAASNENKLARLLHEAADGAVIFSSSPFSLGRSG
jgi:hypothetical protein